MFGQRKSKNMKKYAFLLVLSVMFFTGCASVFNPPMTQSERDKFDQDMMRMQANPLMPAPHL